MIKFETPGTPGRTTRASLRRFSTHPVRGRVRSGGFWRRMPGPSIPKIEDLLVAGDRAAGGRSLRAIKLEADLAVAQPERDGVGTVASTELVQAVSDMALNRRGSDP